MSEIKKVEIDYLPLLSQYIKNYHFKAQSNIILQLPSLKTQPKIGIDVKVTSYKVVEDVFEVNVILKIKGNVEVDGKMEELVSLDLEYAGVFKVEEKDEAKKKRMLLVSCPTIIFPFARTVVSYATVHSNLPPLVLEMIDFDELYKKHNQG